MTQPITLRLADDLEKHVGGNIAYRSSAELRRLHEENITLRQAIEEAEKQERVPESWMGITDNPYCNDANCNDPNGRAMRWHNKLLDLRKKAALDGLEETSREIEQEPVAWVRDLTSPQPHCVTSMKYLSIADTDAGVKYIPVYTVPPSKPWVGLDDIDFQYQPPAEVITMKYAEAILKEKNT